LATDVDFTYDIYSRENVATERLFKNKVLDWLTNGEPKIFKTPTEGNFIVRLMNVSLSPTDSVGRLLHTFSCTAYEIKEYSYDNLKEYGFIVTDEESNLFTQVF
jgi:phage terminase small subunit